MQISIDEVRSGKWGRVHTKRDVHDNRLLLIGLVVGLPPAVNGSDLIHTSKSRKPFYGDNGLDDDVQTEDSDEERDTVGVQETTIITKASE